LTERVLIRLPNWLGDLLMARPLLHALRAARPQATITAVGRPGSRLIERERLWDDWQPWPESRERLADEPRFDAAVVLPPSFSSVWRLPRGIALRSGFAGEWRTRFLTHAWRRPERGEMHLSQEYLHLGAPLGVRPGEERPSPPALLPSPEEREEARRIARARLGEAPYAVLAPGAIYGPAKRWPEERFAALGRRCVARGLGVLVCGAAHDLESAQAVARSIGEGGHVLAGTTTPEAQLALCALATVTISNDSGLAHLAAASGAPTVVVFGSTSSAWTAPLGPRVAIAQRAPVCSPCFQRTCAIGYRCLTAVQVDDVERAWERVAA
jgi:lipopolysaccharide heptosyltransferase II